MRAEDPAFPKVTQFLFATNDGFDLEGISWLTAGILGCWEIEIGLFRLDGGEMARLQLSSSSNEGRQPRSHTPKSVYENYEIPISGFPPLEKAIDTQQPVYVENLTYYLQSDNLDPKLVKSFTDRPAIVAPLVGDGKAIGALIAISPELTTRHIPTISYIAGKMAMHIGHSEKLDELMKEQNVLQTVASKYRNLIDRLSDAIVMTDGAGKILAVNEHLRNILDFSYEELLSKHLSELIEGESENSIWEIFEKTRQKPGTFKLRLKNRKGQVIQTEATMTYSPDADTYQGIFRAKKEPSYLKLVVQEDPWLDNILDNGSCLPEDYHALLRSIIDSYGGLKFLMNPEGRLIYLSPSGVEVTGYSADEFLRHPLAWLRKIHPADRDKVALAYRKALVTGEGHHSLRFKFLHKYRDSAEFMSTAIPLVDSKGRLHGVIGVFQDLSPIVETERERYETSRWEASLFETLNDLVFVLDTDMKIQMINRSCEDILGYGVVDLIGTYLEEIVEDDEIDKIRAGFEQVHETGSVEGMIAKVRHKSGDPVFLEVNATSMIKEGVPVGVRGVARNITERMKFEQREKELHRELVQKEKMAATGELLATVAHGIRNPLSSIKAVAQSTLEDLEPNCPGRTAFRSVMLEADRLALRIKEFLSFYRPFEPNLEMHSLNEIIKESLLMNAEEVKQRNIKLEMNLDWKIPEVLVDFAQIEQVVFNLIGNALGAMLDGGTLKIESSIVSIGAEDVAMVAIEDTGLGIPPELREKIFQPFFTTKEHGTGMGLSVSKRIIENHGGNMKAEEASSGGARLMFWIPILKIE